MLQRPEGEQRERAPEHERIGGGDDEQRPDDGERANRPRALVLPFAPDDGCEDGHRTADDQHRQELDAEQGREWVIEDAVGDEAVPARVPEVVPEDEPVLKEQRALIGVRGEIGSRRAEPDQQRGEHHRSRGGTEETGPAAELEGVH